MMHSSTIPPNRMAFKTMRACHLSSRMRLESPVLVLSEAVIPERKKRVAFRKTPNLSIAASGLEYGLLAAWRAAANETFGRAVLKAVALLRHVREN